MKGTIIIIAILISVAGNAQVKKSDKIKTPTTIDSLDMKIISKRELLGYLQRIDGTAKAQFTIAEKPRYDAILKVLQDILAEAEQKRKQK